MTIHYQKYSPTGNITVLATTPVPRPLQPRVAAKLLSPEGVGGEQAGFIEAPSDPGCAARLQMMGGEFCGNATMSLGAMLAREAGLADGQSRDFPLEVSGADVPVNCRIRRKGDAWIGTVDIPRPIGFGWATLDTDAGPINAPLVRFPGIAHLIIPDSAGLEETQLRRRLPLWNRDIRADALGALVWNEDALSIDPLVFVPSAGTLVREHGCGSGTAAVGCWLALRNGRDVEAPVAQPGGTITVKVGIAGDAVTRLSIAGRVELVEEGDYSL